MHEGEQVSGHHTGKCFMCKNRSVLPKVEELGALEHVNAIGIDIHEIYRGGGCPVH